VRLRERLDLPSGRDVVGLNRRFIHIEHDNDRAAKRLADDKIAAKRVLGDAGIPHVPTLVEVHDRRALTAFDFDALPDAWALKPSHGHRGKGIILAVGRDGDAWRTPSGARETRRMLRRHMSTIVDGDFARYDQRDAVMFEPFLRPSPALARLAPAGLPDVRVVCRDARPVMAMLRLPTEASDGKANLHQDGIGCAVDLDSGRVVRVVQDRREIRAHPDTGAPLLGLQLPQWPAALELSVRCAQLSGLRLIGVDLAVVGDDELLVLEINPRPGIEIQNVNGAGWRERPGWRSP
jgi:alpha-L-glutamate ligase-like protein